ncbi:MAG: hypothetical protein MRERV_42c017 [Mycoplasmataceae bacterium RV_VA103A]|nr:MAG: hypothetical protein MRERV_42c017 [Mycoplasmataceae bacterium RV_VA103A]
MNKKIWFGLIFFLFFLFVALWKWWAWVIWKILNWRKERQVFDLISKNRFIEITGASGKGKSWLLSHCFKNLQGVKFTNMPTPQGLYTLNHDTLEIHISGKWGAPHKFYYFLDDIEKFQKWSKKQFGHHGYKSLQEYIGHAGKLGGAFIWTSNGVDSPYIFKTQKNATWRVVGHINFSDYSLLLVIINNWRPTLLPISNKEIESFYDPHWNIPKDYQRNWLLYISQRMKGEELKDIVKMVEKNKSHKDWSKDIEYKWKEIEKYNKLRTIEEVAQRKKKQKFSEEQKKIKRYKLKTAPLTFSDLAELDKEDKWEAKNKLAAKSEAGKTEIMEGEKAINELEEKKTSNQELADKEKEIKITKKKHGKKNKKR